MDAGEVDLESIRRRITSELLTNVDEDLSRGDIDVGDGVHVEDDGFEKGSFGFAFAELRGHRVVPWSIARSLCVCEHEAMV